MPFTTRSKRPYAPSAAPQRDDIARAARMHRATARRSTAAPRLTKNPTPAMTDDIWEGFWDALVDDAPLHVWDALAAHPRALDAIVTALQRHAPTPAAPPVTPPPSPVTASPAAHAMPAARRHTLLSLTTLGRKVLATTKGVRPW